MQNLFINSNGYYFELGWVEFSGFLPILSIIIVFCLTLFLIFRKTQYRHWLLLSLLILVLNILFIGFTKNDLVQGIRRFTPSIIAFYLLLIICWAWALKQKTFLKWTIILILLIIPMHHILVYLPNLESVKKESIYRDLSWFVPPRDSLKPLLNKLQTNNLSLICPESANCSYVFIYTALKSSCYYNNLNCFDIYGYDFDKKVMMELNENYWKDNEGKW